MPRTKRRFNEEDVTTGIITDPADPDDTSVPSETVYARTSFGGGKQLRAARGGGKQIRIQTEDDSDDDDDEDDEEEQEMMNTQPLTYNRPSPIGGGKQFHPVGGKQFHHMGRPEESDDDDEEEEEEEEEEPVVYSAGVGKSLQRMGKQLRRPIEPKESEEDEDDYDEEEKGQELKPARVEHNPSRGGKMLRPYNPSPEPEEDNMSIDESESEEEEVEEDTPAPPPRRSTRPTRAAKSPPKKLETDDMQESSEDSSDDDDFDSDEEEELDVETFDYERLIEDEADRKMLDSLPEVERESILAERFEKFKNAADMKKALRENKRQERERKRLESGKQGKGSKGKKVVKKGQIGKKNAVDTSKDSQLAKEMAFDRAAKNKDVFGVKAKRKAALEQLRKDRANKNEDEESDLDYGDDNEDESDGDEEYNEEVKPWQKTKRATRLSSLPDDDDEASDDDRVSAKKRTPKVFVEADVADYVKVTVPRRRLARWCNEPFFEQAVLDFYVRVAIGRDKSTQRPCYRLCKIAGIISKEQQYKIDDQTNQYAKPVKTSNNPIETNKYLELEFGDSRKQFKISYISDTIPTDDEVNAYVSQLKNRRVKNLLSKKDAAKMRKAQDELVNNYTYTTEDIQRAVEEKKSLSKKISNIGADKTRTLISVSAAEALYEEALKEKNELEKLLLEADETEEEEIKDKMESVQSRLVELMDDLNKKQKEHNKILEAEALRIKRIQNSDKVQNWARVNQRAKAANKAADQEAYKNEKGSQESTSKDVYARRKVKPQILWEVGQKTDEPKDADSSKENTDTVGSVEASRDGFNDLSNKVNTHDGNGIKSKLSKQMNDLAIEEETLTNNGLNGMNNKKSVETRVRKGLSFQQYLERKSAGTL